MKKRKKKTKSFDLHSYRRTYSFNRRIRAFARACIIQCNLLILTYLLYHLSPRYFRLYVTYIHIHIHIHIYIHPYNIRTHTHTFVHTNRHIKRPFSRCTRDIESSNKKKETREKSEKKKEKKKKKRKRETNERRVFVSHIRECSLFHLHFSPFY